MPVGECNPTFPSPLIRQRTAIHDYEYPHLLAVYRPPLFSSISRSTKKVGFLTTAANSSVLDGGNGSSGVTQNFAGLSSAQWALEYETGATEPWARITLACVLALWLPVWLYWCYTVFHRNAAGGFKVSTMCYQGGGGLCFAEGFPCEHAVFPGDGGGVVLRRKVSKVYTLCSWGAGVVLQRGGSMLFTSCVVRRRGRKAWCLFVGGGGGEGGARLSSMERRGVVFEPPVSARGLVGVSGDHVSIVAGKVLKQ